MALQEGSPSVPSCTRVTTVVPWPPPGPKPIPFAAVQKYIRNPTGQMPPYTAKVVPDKDLADIYAFLQSVAAPPPAKSIPLLNN